jgi:hypothetical protein
LLSRELERVGRGPVNDMATSGMGIAKGQVTASEARFISMKPTKEFPLRSGRLPSLSRMLEIPVALITNNSHWAAVTEYGSAAHAPKRPLSTAFDRLRPKASLAIRGTELPQ